jgi:hypothetical protein
VKKAASQFPVRWACYLAYFVGVSFQSGGIVHYSLNPARYGRLIIIGAVIFVVGAIGSDLIEKESVLRSSGPAGFASFIASSLVLSIGVGLIGGSVQHFSDIPNRAPYFIGMGLLLSAIGFHGRFRPHRRRKEMVAGIALVALLTVPVVGGLRAYASQLPASIDEHAHSGGASEPSPPIAEAGHSNHVDDAHHDVSSTTAAPTPQTVPASVPETAAEATSTTEAPTPTTSTSVPPTGDGHTDHAHG